MNHDRNTKLKYLLSQQLFSIDHNKKYSKSMKPDQFSPSVTRDFPSLSLKEYPFGLVETMGVEEKTSIEEENERTDMKESRRADASEK